MSAQPPPPRSQPPGPAPLPRTPGPQPLAQAPSLPSPLPQPARQARRVLDRRALASYALFALPLAMMALPVYLFAPPLYVRSGGLPLAEVGAVLLAVRVLAALADPLLGWWMARSGRAYAWHAALSLPLLLAGCAALFHPPPLAAAALLAWFGAALMLVYLGYGLATIAHQSWGAALAADASDRVRLMSSREGCGLLGAVLAAGCSDLLGYGALSLVFGACLLCAAWLLLRRAPRPGGLPTAPDNGASLAELVAPQPGGPCVAPDGTAGLAELIAPWREARFRALFSIYAASALAGAVPATLFVFFAADRVRLPDSWAGPLLVLYLLAAAGSMPLWSALARRWGEIAAWQCGMLMSALVFIWAYALGPSDGGAFAAICVLTGLAGGADLALPPALLASLSEPAAAPAAGLVAAAPAPGATLAAPGTAAQLRAPAPGAPLAVLGPAAPSPAPYFAWWNWCTQLALALAAGATLPLLALLGYQPGSADPGTGPGPMAVPQGTAVLAAAYALLPCALKLLAWLLLMRAATGSLKGLTRRHP